MSAGDALASKPGLSHLFELALDFKHGRVCRHMRDSRKGKNMRVINATQTGPYSYWLEFLYAWRYVIRIVGASQSLSSPVRAGPPPFNSNVISPPRKHFPCQGRYEPACRALRNCNGCAGE